MTSHELFIEELAEIFDGLTVNIKVSWPQIAIDLLPVLKLHLA
jgi:hypothetical protein